jgi:predicted DNA-binding transcriptional regulator AlpA
MSKELPIQLDKVIELTGYSKAYIYKLVHYKKIPCHKPGGKAGKLFFLESEIIDFLTRNRQSADYELSERADAILNGEARFKNRRQ